VILNFFRISKLKFIIKNKKIIVRFFLFFLFFLFYIFNFNGIKCVVNRLRKQKINYLYSPNRHKKAQQKVFKKIFRIMFFLKFLLFNANKINSNIFFFFFYFLYNQFFESSYFFLYKINFKLCYSEF